MFVFDIGEGSGETLTLMGIPLDRVQGVWLTHLHSDHFEGLGPFTLQRWAGTSAMICRKPICRTDQGNARR